MGVSVSDCFASKDEYVDLFNHEKCREIARILEVEPLDNIVKRDGSVTIIVDELFHRLNWIGRVFQDENTFNEGAGPAKIRKRVGLYRRKIQSALKVLNSFSGHIRLDPSQQVIDTLIQRSLFNISGVDPRHSAGLLGYDMTFDENFATAVDSLSKVERCFAIVEEEASLSVGKQGKNKPGNPFADSMLAELCGLYRDITGEPPKAYMNSMDDSVEGRIIGFLIQILPILRYPLEIGEVALESKLRDIKADEKYSWPWSGFNENI